MLNDSMVKEELHNINENGETTFSYISALLYVGCELVLVQNGLYFCYTTSDYLLAMEFSRFMSINYGYAAEIGINQPVDKRRKRSFTVEVHGKMCKRILTELGKLDVCGDKIIGFSKNIKKHVRNQKDASEFARGIFLSCGNLSRAESGYRLTLSFEEENTCDDFLLLLTTHCEMKKTIKDNLYYLVTRKGQAISDFFAFIGASKSVLKVQDYLVNSEARGKILRAANLDAANVDKSISAAVMQYNDILYIKKQTNFYGLSEELKEFTLARLENADASLAELVEVIPNKISKSGLYHRLKKLNALAIDLKESEKLNKKNKK